MTISFMRTVDEYVGDFICFFLFLYEALTGLVKKNNSVAVMPRKILFIKFFGMGSILLATPAIRAVRKTYPKAKIYFLTFKENTEIVKNLGCVDEIIPIRTDRLVNFLKDALFPLIRLRAEKIDVVFNMEFFARLPVIFAYVIGAELRAGFYHIPAFSARLLTHRVWFNHYRHITQLFMSIVNSAGVNSDDLTLIRPLITLKAEKMLDEQLKENGCQGHLDGVNGNREIVCVNVNSGALSLERRWPKESFARLISMTVKEFNNYDYVFLGGVDDMEYVSTVTAKIGKIPQIANLAGKLSLESLAALLKRCRLFITNDSGPLHIAVSLDVPTISFFGPETPLLYGPPPTRRHIVFKKDIPCSPCMSVHNAKVSSCSGDNICMKLITVDEVFRCVKERLSDYDSVRALSFN